MRHELQLLRDRAEQQSLQCHERGDADSSEAWERIGMELDQVQRVIAHDWQTIQERTGLFERTEQ